MAKRAKPPVGSSGPPPGGDEPKTKVKKRRLTWAQERFVEEFIDNKGNATQAYLKAHPGCTYGTAMMAGNDYLRRPHILEAIDAQREADRKLLNFDRHQALKLLIAMATSSLDDFTEVYKGVDKRANYRGLGLKRMALESAKMTERYDQNGGCVITNEIKIISPSERRAVLNDLWEKLGFGASVDKGISADTLGEVLQFFANAKKSGEK
jgi:hypothetical protein